MSNASETQRVIQTPSAAASDGGGSRSFDDAGERYYKYGAIYFEESRIKCKYMLCGGNAPGACTPEEVLAEFTDAFGLELPSMCFRGLGAHGWWESGFSTLDYQSQLDAVAGQVRSRHDKRYKQRLMSVPDERARTALAAWGTLTLLDKNIADNAVVTKVWPTERSGFANALFTYNSAGVEVLRAMDYYNYARKKESWSLKRRQPKKYQELGKKIEVAIMPTIMDFETSLTREGMREFEEVGRYYEGAVDEDDCDPDDPDDSGADDSTGKMPGTAHQLVAWCVERDAGRKRPNSEDVRLKEQQLIQNTGRLLGDPERIAEKLAAIASLTEKRPAEAPAPGAEDIRPAPAMPVVDAAVSIGALAQDALNALKQEGGGMYRKQLLKSIFDLVKSIFDLKMAWRDVCEVAKLRKEIFTKDVVTLLRERQLERNTRLYEIRKSNYASRGSCFMGAVVQAAYESKGWLITEWNCRDSMNSSPVMFEKGVERFPQLNDVSRLTYLGLYDSATSRGNELDLHGLPGVEKIPGGDESSRRDEHERPFEIYQLRAGVVKPVNLEEYATPSFQDARTYVYPSFEKQQAASDAAPKLEKLRKKWPRRDCAMRLRILSNTPLPGDEPEDVETMSTLLRAEISPYCTHMIFFRHTADKEAFADYLWRLLPHATTVMCGKSPYTFTHSIKCARGGGQLILLRSSGFWVDQMCQAIVDARERSTPGYRQKSTLTVPSDVHDSSWLVFDAVREDANHIADRITKCLSMASREESAIIGFNQSEQARLLYAWQLVLTYRCNFQRLDNCNFALSSLTILCAMITACTGLVAYADPVFARGRGDVAAGLLSIITGFLLAAQRYFEFGTKAAACELAESEVKSLIYHYRTRTGDFSYGDGGGSQLKASLVTFRAARADRQAREQAFTRAFEKHTQGVLQDDLSKAAETHRQPFETPGHEANGAGGAVGPRPAPGAWGSNLRAERFQDQLVAAEARLRQSDVRTEPLQPGQTFAEYKRAGHMYNLAYSGLS